MDKESLDKKKNKQKKKNKKTNKTDIENTWARVNMEFFLERLTR